jgi:hypothetical protein
VRRTLILLGASLVAGPALAAPCPEPLDLPAALDQATAQLAERPDLARATLADAEERLVCLLAPADPVDLARLWQLAGLAALAVGDRDAGVAALRQAAAMPVDEPVVATEQVDALEPYFEALSSNWALGRLIVGPVAMDADVHVDGVRQDRTFAPVRAPARHLVQVVEGDAIVFARLVDAPEGDLEVLTTPDPKAERRARRDARRDAGSSDDGSGGGALRVAALGAGVAALGLGAASFALNQRAGALAADGDRSGAARAFDTNQTLAVAAGATGVAAGAALGLSFAIKF